MEGSPQPGIRLRWTNQRVEKRLPVAVGKYDRFMPRDRRSRSLGQCGQAKVSQAATLERGRPLHQFFGLCIHAKAKTGAASAAFFSTCQRRGLRDSLSAHSHIVRPMGEHFQAEIRQRLARTYSVTGTATPRTPSDSFATPSTYAFPASRCRRAARPSASATPGSRDLL